MDRAGTVDHRGYKAQKTVRYINGPNRKGKLAWN